MSHQTNPTASTSCVLPTLDSPTEQRGGGCSAPRRGGPRRFNVALILILLLHVALLAGFGPAPLKADAANYWRQAQSIRRGEFRAVNGGQSGRVIAHRVGVTLPAVYSPFPSAWPSLASLATIVLAYVAAKRLAGRRAGLAAAFILATSPIQLRFAGLLLPEIPLSLGLTAAAVAAPMLPFVAACAWWGAFLCKGTAI